MKKKEIHLLSCTLILLLFHCSSNSDRTHEIDINFSHLEYLSESIKLNGDSVDIIHIYSNYPEYKWTDATSEGIACVDDVARAAVVYLRYYELYGDTSVLTKAKRLLRFVLALQADDGEFYNFIHKDYSINKISRSSVKSFDFWAARAYWALAKGYKIFSSIDQKFAQTLRKKFLKCKAPLKNILVNYPRTIDSNGIHYPTWLVNKYGADATAELLLGLADFLLVEYDAELIEVAKKLSLGILAMQLPDSHEYAGAFLSWKDIWHGWGNSQMQALARIYPIMSNEQFLKAIKKEADSFASRIVVQGRIREIDLNSGIKSFPQIAYSIRCQAVGLLKLYEITKDERYAILAGIVASWLTGNNLANTPMYDSKTGKVYDGINDYQNINKNSGAESTIEGLYTLIEISKNPIANNFINYYAINRDSIKWNSSNQHEETQIFQDSSGRKIVIKYSYSDQNFYILRN